MNHKLLIFIIIIILITLFFLCEIDRNFLIRYNFKSYYIDNFPIALLNGFHNSIYRFYENRIIFNPEDFDFHKFLTENKKKIIKEFNTNKNKLISDYAHDTSPLLDKNESYKYIRFKFYKKIFEENVNNFEIIKQLLSKYQNIQTCFFSIMKKKIKIDYHKGPYNGVLRYHFPIIVEDIDKCYLEVLNKKIKYDSPFIFDDTFPHQLTKDDDTYKVVLIIDIDNPYSYYFKHHNY